MMFTSKFCSDVMSFERRSSYVPDPLPIGSPWLAKLYFAFNAESEWSYGFLLARKRKQRVTSVRNKIKHSRH